jgi:hypothetical protein
MKRLSVASVLLVALGSAAVFGQQAPYPQGGQYGGAYAPGTTQGGATAPGMMQGGGYGGGMMQGGMGPGMMQGGRGYGRGYMEHGHGRGPCMGCMVACASMVMPHLVATSDGGVVVAIGGRLIKYNADLRRVADTAIEIDWTEVQRRVEQIVQNCPINRRQMMMQQRGAVPGQPGGFQGQQIP